MQLENFFRPEILNMPAYAVNSSKNMIKLDAMENPYTLDDDISKQLSEYISKAELNRYPSNEVYTNTLQSIKNYINLSSEYELMLGNGSDEIISILINSIPNNSYVLSPAPSFVMYKVSSMLSRVNHIEVDLDKNFDLDLDNMLKAIDKYQPKLIFLAYPNNPTGNCFNEDKILKIIDYAQNSLIIIDEAYQPFTNGKSFLNSDSMQNPRVLVMRTLSKLGLAGLRLGYLAGQSHVINEINKARPPYNINILTQYAVQFLLQKSQIFHNQALIICEERKNLIHKLQKFGKVYDSDANFVLLKLAKDATSLEKILKSQGILVKNASKMHPLLENCLRISVGNIYENNALIYALEQIFQHNIDYS